jgi:hypothetical protein
VHSNLLTNFVEVKGDGGKIILTVHLSNASFFNEEFASDLRIKNEVTFFFQMVGNLIFEFLQIRGPLNVNGLKKLISALFFNFI